MIGKRAQTNRFCRLQEQVRALEKSRVEQKVEGVKLVDTLTELAPARTVRLTQADFARGHVALNQANTRYVLDEDIVFAPTPMTPTPADVEGNQALRLGFFTAITIEASNIVLDLNNHKLSQSEAHARRQRFFSLITLGDQPFPKGKGPADFGDFVSCENVRIENGTLGRSSHHGIQGNNCKNVLVQNLTVKNFEFAGIAINHAQDTILRNLHVGPSLRALPAKATLSAANFIVPLMERSTDQHEQVVQNALITLRNFLNDLHDFGTVAGNMQATFGEGGSLPDGNVYGIMLHGSVHVDGFSVRTDDVRQPKHNVLVENVVVQDLLAGDQHVVVLAHPEHGHLTDRFKAVMHYAAPDVLTSTHWTPTPLLIVQAGSVLASTNAKAHEKELARFVLDNAAGISRADALAKFRALNLHPVYGGDAMFHKCKGVLGLKLDGMHGVTVRGCEIVNLDNEGSNIHLLDEFTPKVFFGKQINDEDNDPDETDHARYCGNDVRGVSVAGCQGVQLQDVGVTELASRHGPVTGIDVFNGSNMIKLERIIVLNIGSRNTDLTDDGVHALPTTCGIRSRASVTAFSFNDCVVDWSTRARPAGAESIALRNRVRLRQGAGGEVCTNCLSAFDEFGQ